MNANPESSLDPRNADRILREQHASARRALTYPDHLMYLLWGTAYTVGYLPLALSQGDDPLVDLPVGLALGILFISIVTAVALSIWITEHHARGIRGDDAQRGAMYGIAWWVAFLGVIGVWTQLDHVGLTGDEGGVLLNGVCMLLVGVLFMAGGVAWLDRTQYVIGGVIVLTTGVALVFGLPAYYWILTTVTGVGMLLVGLTLTLLGRRTA